MHFRSRDRGALENIATRIKDQQKKSKAKEEEAKSKKECFEFKDMILAKGDKPFLRDVVIRPTPENRGSKKIQGLLEAHENGFRFTSNSKDKYDIAYANIKNALIQKADIDGGSSACVAVHFHLKQAMMLGKRKTTDVQFMENVIHEDEAGMRGPQTDEQAIADENRERERVDRKNKEFADFGVNVDEKVFKRHGVDLRFDSGYLELKFEAAAGGNRGVYLPGNESLFSIVEFPPSVISLAEVDIAVLERVQKNAGRVRMFDLTFVFKDYTRPPKQLTMVPGEAQESIKQWLVECDIAFYEYQTNLQWNQMMKEINANLEEFVEGGCWEGYLGGEESEEEEEEEDEESAYEESGSSEEDEDDDESEYEPSEESDEDEEDDDEEGMDWDELEKKAAADDRNEAQERKRKGEQHSDDERPSRKRGRR
jgi:nucleosome binding factor SPN SPT16 subunit